MLVTEPKVDKKALLKKHAVSQVFGIFLWIEPTKEPDQGKMFLRINYGSVSKKLCLTS